MIRNHSCSFDGINEDRRHKFGNKFFLHKYLKFVFYDCLLLIYAS